MSVLFPGLPEPSLRTEPPAAFHDLLLDQIVDAVIAGREEYNLAPYYFTLLRTVGEVRHRQAVMRDLQDPSTRGCVAGFCTALHDVRSLLDRSGEMRNAYSREVWFVQATRSYTAAVRQLDADLAPLPLRSAALGHLRDHLHRYTAGAHFRHLDEETEQVLGSLAAVRYRIHVHDAKITVSPYEEGEDFGTEIEATFARFAQGAARDYRHRYTSTADLDHVEAHVIDLVARIEPEPFEVLHRFVRTHHDFQDPTMERFDREVQFFLAYLDFVDTFTQDDLKFCVPEVSATTKTVSVRATFDLALAAKLRRMTARVIRNDVALHGRERIVVVSGPNQGGKTTFARTFGQLHHLAAIGLLVPGEHAELPLCDGVFTHFEREEDLAQHSGKLEDDLVRVHDILQRSTARSVLVMNETFTSTTLDDARLLGTAVLRNVVDLDALCVYVTFVDELVSVSDTVVSMVSTVDPDAPARRTYRVVRRAPDGLAYAEALASQYGITYRQLRDRLAS